MDTSGRDNSDLVKSQADPGCLPMTNQLYNIVEDAISF